MYFILNNQWWLKVLLSAILFCIILVPIENIISKIAQYILSKIVKPKLIPKLDFQNGIPEKFKTMVVVPTIVKSKEKVKELMGKLEVYYIANKSENLYFTLLGDCSSGSKEIENFDEEVIRTGIEETEKLNKKYGEKFNFIYRKRKLNANEECYIGWERKRGLLNQFNEYLLGNIENPFRISTFKNIEEFKNIQYIITLDSDTDLTLNSALKLVGAMAHILNKPVLNDNKDLVISGHALMQPRVGIGLLESRRSVFTQIYAGEGGTDSYTNVISNTYQDNFDEGIFTGKGIYDVNTFSKVLEGEIRENAVLSHDLLEGNYLRCGLVSDVMLMDGYPTNYLSFRTRLYRWIRGDFQILPWLKKTIINKKGERKNNPLGLLSKYKIFSNIVRSKVEFFALMTIIYSLILAKILKLELINFVLIGLITILIPVVIDVVNAIISKKEGIVKTKKFVKTIDGLRASLLRGILDFLLIPDKAYITTKAEIKTIYRMTKTKKYLLEWTTSEEAERTAKTDLISYYKEMRANSILAILGLIVYFCITITKPTFLVELIILILSLLWFIAPAIMFQISKKNEQALAIEKLNKQEKDYIMDVGYKTWLYFKENLIQRGNYLPPDNYQEDRKPKVVMRTSPTNIGLALLAVMSSYDLKYENLEDTIELLYKMINTISNLTKWNGHLYNWYNIETLEPLIPRYISSVDSGNFVGYLYVLKQFLLKEKEEYRGSRTWI